MRPQENSKSNQGPKVTSTVQISHIIRLPIKKIYCSKCQRLVRGHAEGANDTTKVSCPRCSERLWFRGSLSWRSIGKNSEVTP
jgi:DNA-directed RNA polymerase subunit RPC12/RpoP